MKKLVILQALLFCMVSGFAQEAKEHAVVFYGFSAKLIYVKYADNLKNEALHAD